MLNLLSLNCGLAFAPYLVESLSAFLNDDASLSQVVRQGGTGLIFRSASRVQIRHQNREAELGRQETLHYLATLKFRVDSLDVQRTSGEIVLASLGPSLMISHPQSDLWLDAEAVRQLLVLAGTVSEARDHVAGLPEWLSVSTATGQLLISDQRNGRWVLLGSDHIAELERRVARSGVMQISSPLPKPPVIVLKGVTVHLQSAERLVESLQALGERGEVLPFEEVAPFFSLRVAGSVEGIELSDSNTTVGINAREARKLTAIVRAELDRLNVTSMERGSIRTVFADGEDGRWVLQWGDEVLIPPQCFPRGSVSGSDPDYDHSRVATRHDADLVLLMSPADGACVALNRPEVQQLIG